MKKKINCDINENQNRYATKQPGKTEVDPFWSAEDIKNVVTWFVDKKEYDGYLITILGLLLGRRISDIIMFKWSDFYFKNGSKRDSIALCELKTGKNVDVPLSQMVFDSIDQYCEWTGTIRKNVYDNYMFNVDFKTEWIERKDNLIYKENDLEKWIEHFSKDFSEKRKQSILNGFKKQKENGYQELGQYLYWVVEYNDINKWQTDKYRKLLVQATVDSGIKYRVSTHTLRKTFGKWIMDENPYDPNCIYSVQRLLAHSSMEYTLRYIGMTKEKDAKYVHEHGNVIYSILNGSTEILKTNSPVVTLKNEDLRQILMFVIQNKDKNEIDLFNAAMTMVDRLRLIN